LPPLPPPPPKTQLFLEAVTQLELKKAAALAPAAYGTWWMNLVREDPWHVVVETLLLIFVVYLLFLKKPKKSRSELTKADVEELINDWKPAPLVPPLSETDKKVLASTVVVSEYLGSDQLVCGLPGERPVKCLNLTTYDFLGLSTRNELKESAKDTLNEYGCGSCGPRGFYGSVMPHMEIEAAVAKFMGTEGAISYSDTASTLSSTIPAFAKKGDLVVCDESCAQAIKVGIDLSRARAIYFKHNDLADLKKTLETVARDDRRLGRDPSMQRRFIVSEALFKADGSMAPLEGLINLKKQFGYRLILDETLSFCVLGPTGRGLTEHLGLPVMEVDILVVTLEYGLASVGGLCLGSTEVVDHQRLSGAGYCFSASAPPFVSSTAERALELVVKEPEQLLGALRANTTLARRFLDASAASTWLETSSDPLSPVVHLSLRPNVAKMISRDSSNKDSFAVEFAALAKVSGRCLTKGRTALCLGRRIAAEAPSTSRPTLRIAVKASLTEAQIREAVKAIAEACRAVLPTPKA